MVRIRSIRSAGRPKAPPARAGGFNFMVARRGVGAPVLIAAAVLAIAVTAAAAWPVPAGAEGALAVGQPSDVAGQGFAYGMAVNAPNADAASSQALDACRGAKAARPAARATCKIVGTLHQQCAAVAMDPAAGTPGAGWGVGDDKSTAESRALQACYTTAGADRVSYCKVTGSACDTRTFNERNQ